MGVVEGAEVFGFDVSINLGGADVCVAEHFLDGAEVSAVMEEVGGEGVAEEVREDVLGDASDFGVALAELPEALGGEGFAAEAEEEVGGGARADEFGATCDEPFFDG